MSADVHGSRHRRSPGCTALLFGAPGFQGEGYTGGELGSGWLMAGPQDHVLGTSSDPDGNDFQLMSPM